MNQIKPIDGFVEIYLGLICLHQNTNSCLFADENIEDLIITNSQNDDAEFKRLKPFEAEYSIERKEEKKI